MEQIFTKTEWMAVLEAVEKLKEDPNNAYAGLLNGISHKTKEILREHGPTTKIIDSKPYVPKQVRGRKIVPSTESKFEQIRAEKVDKLTELGIDPWGSRFDDRTPITEIRTKAPE